MAACWAAKRTVPAAIPWRHRAVFNDISMREECERQIGKKLREGGRKKAVKKKGNGKERRASRAWDVALVQRDDKSWDASEMKFFGKKFASSLYIEIRYRGTGTCNVLFRGIRNLWLQNLNRIFLQSYIYFRGGTCGLF